VGFASQPARVNAVVLGLVILTLALWSLQDDGQSAAKETSTQ
jgi:hypothetical protein